MSSSLHFRRIFSVRELPVYYLREYSEVSDLANYINHNAPDIAIDQERAPYNKYYYQKPSLIQISTRDSIFFIDVLKKKEIITPLSEILTNPLIAKVFVDASSDLYYFNDYFGIKIKGLFDILIAHTLCHPHSNTTPGLPELVHNELGISDFKKSKKDQKSDWTQRPLTESQLKYASKEIAVFLPLYDKLKAILNQKKLIPFSNYGNKRLEIEFPDLGYNSTNILRVKGFDSLTNDQKHRAMKLGLVRDKIAQKRDKPFYFVFSNEQLLRLAKKSNSLLSNVFSSRQKFSKKELKLIKEVISEELDKSPFVLQTNHVNFSDLPQLQQKLLLWRNQIGKEFDIPKRFILSKEEILLLDYSTIESVIKKIWFSQQNNIKCVQLTNSLLSALNN
jgi:ribonuclease D